MRQRKDLSYNLINSFQNDNELIKLFSNYDRAFNIPQNVKNAIIFNRNNLAKYIIDTLLSRGKKINKYALDVAVSTKNIEIINYLISKNIVNDLINDNIIENIFNAYLSYIFNPNSDLVNEEVILNAFIFLINNNDDYRLILKKKINEYLFENEVKLNTVLSNKKSKILSIINRLLTI